MKIEIVPGLCMGSGNCSFHAPATFDLDDNMSVTVLDPRGDSDEAILRAADGCPTKAILVSLDPAD